MKSVNLSKTLKPYTSGWVAVNKNTNKAITHAKNFKTIAEKVKNTKNVLLIPASDKYFGFITKTDA